MLPLHSCGITKQERIDTVLWIWVMLWLCVGDEEYV